MNDGRLLIYLIAGEESGDRLGGPLMRELQDMLDGQATFAGIGGPMMTDAGLESLFPMQELSVMGLTEVLPRLPGLIRRINQVTADIRARRPDLLLTIDAPDFCFRVAKRLKGEGIPLVHYVAPTVWAWRPGRAKKVAGFLDHLLALLPFEPPYFEAHGLACTYVGHPVLESGADKGDGAAFRQARGIGAEAPLMVLLPGSRRGEVRRLLPVFTETLQRLRSSVPGLQLAIPTVPATRELVAAAAADLGVPIHLIDNDADKFDAFAAADAALAASGTVALELAMAGTPTVIGYRMAPITAYLARRLVKSPYANLVNVILGREAVPERVLEDCQPDILATEIERLFSSADARHAQIQTYQEALSALGHGTVRPNRRAAETVFSILRAKENGAA
jgi:lipid-A-disaccharide synthase